MARSKSTLQIYAEYLPVRAFFALLALLPLSLAERAGQALVWALALFLPRRRRMMKANLALSFPNLDEAARERIAEDHLRYLGRGIGVFAHIPRIVRNGFSGVVDVAGREHVEAAIQKGRGVLLFSAHYGCWEMLGGYVPSLFTAGMVVRLLDNPKLDALVAKVRSSAGGIVVSRKDIFREGLRILRRNGVLGILMDQNTAKGGVFVDFFGRLAATTNVVSLLARRTGAVIIPMHSVWIGHKIRVVFESPVSLSSASDPTKAQWEDTQRMTSIIESWIRDDPAQWLWLHNRWKRQPLPEESVYRLPTQSAGLVR